MKYDWKTTPDDLRNRPRVNLTLRRETTKALDDLAAKWGVSRSRAVERLVEESTMKINQVEGTRALYLKYPGQSSPQGCFVELDCEKRTLSAGYNPEIGNATPFRVYHGRAIRWTIPCLTDDAVNGLLAELAEDAAAVCDGYACEWDGSNHVGQLDDNAKTAAERIREAIDRDWSERDTVNIWDASDWYEPVLDVAATLSIDANTTDERIAEIAKAEKESAEVDGHTIEGVEEYLTRLRDELQSAR
jgi:hypothetical protein